jgi:hypothetical protein
MQREKKTKSRRLDSEAQGDTGSMPAQATSPYPPQSFLAAPQVDAKYCKTKQKEHSGQNNIDWFFCSNAGPQEECSAPHNNKVLRNIVLHAFASSI